MTHTPKTSHGRLTIVTNLDAFIFENGDLLLTKKFLEGAYAYATRWNAPVRVLLRQTDIENDNLDNQRISRYDLPFEIEIADFFSNEMTEKISGSALVLAAVGHQQNHISRLCNQMNIPCIYVTEYSLRARLQSMFYNEKNPARLIRGVLWNLRQEHKQRQAIAKAQGLQANGTPTYAAYKKLTPKPLLYFDNRILENDLITTQQLSSRLETLKEHRPIRLAFSGRLIRMKGADYLIPLCKELEKRALAYEMTIFGNGHLEQEMKQEIKRAGIVGHVHMTGAVDFRSKLLPALQKSVDLFVCCHVQGDPSCTYMETFACGLPIAGYNNEAFQGILNYSVPDIGRSAPIGNTRALADQIQLLDSDRELLTTMSYNARDFASAHCFEQTFDRRINHMVEVASHAI